MKIRWTMTWALCALLGCSEKAPDPEPLIRSVRYTVVESQNAARRQTFSGTIVAGTTVRMSFQVPGRVRSLAVNVGDQMKKGQLVAKLDPTDFELQLREAQASAAQSEAQARSAAASYERVRALYENRNASRQDLDNARANRDTSNSAVTAAKEAVRRLQRQLQYATLSAPAKGTISEVEVENNEVVNAGQVVAELQVGEQLEVAVAVPESIINQIERDDEAVVDVTAIDQEVKGRVYEVGVPGSGSSVFPINVRLEQDASKRVRAGMAAEVTFLVGGKAEGDPKASPRLLPATAVGEDRDGRFVFVVERTESGRGVVHRRPAKLGHLVGEEIELLDGVEDGELVVTAGVSRIRDGLTVKVPEPDGAPAAEPSAQPSASAQANESAKDAPAP